MISEHLQDQAIAYLFGELSSAQQSAFESELRGDVELQAFVRQMRESMGLLASAVPQVAPPADLKARIMAAARGETEQVPVPPMNLPLPNSRRAPVAWMAVSAVLLFVAFAAAFDAWTTRVRYAGQSDQIASMTRDVEKLHGLLDTQQRQIAALESENSLSQIRVATLNPQVPPLGQATAVVVWNAGKQQGLIKGDHLAGAGMGKDYQLWLIDPSAPAPISAGLITVNGDGSFATSFKPVRPVTSVAKFAISVEAAGGSDTPHGPIVFIGG